MIAIGICAGEASGDALGASLIRELKSRRPDLTFFGIGGPQMIGEGCESWFPQEELAVRGYLEVLRKLPRILSIRKQLTKCMKQQAPRLFIGIDAPDFNLGVERKLKAAGITTLHYVSPSVWAWRLKRIWTIAKSVDHLLALFPFEPAIYAPTGLPVTYVGHPMADAAPLEIDTEALRERYDVPMSTPVFALLPGSRVSELIFHAELFVAVAQKIQSVLPEAQFFVPLVTRKTREIFEQALWQAQAADKLRLALLYGHADDALILADCALVASGTATLEAALHKCPHVITYRIKPATYRMVKRKLRLPYVGLPNVLHGRFLVPEILQDDATDDNLSQALLNLYADAELRQRIQAHFMVMHQALRQNASARAADVVLALLAKSGHA